uniref:Thiolase C-terminal domain-containing protein n=1 Tax=Eucampia antarctica TaxID=49252 RepID=A0A7S2R4R6_9STRA|mmetsp:Transcript_16555/g.15976  ORF Transcript_16555/g.15976 Transcript_16555/m.15976 type:complete len:477 (+) Transcript_16555:75-1505(+)|eukprot:CAMPEP_0197825136 /NCGR_PEP_ID=MMETSP1437-20131217/2263_1 /TAXON_ID=49252 ORGANISM="Eucampia antarctica, Strain CCMP1452" /NCGR_SAMPLE_ID=MMETSP1437 /ASSEMBLY_ACC=CAM_ASM_001096 /LENGTH=476 /DNA_ID=CAMNT_0043425009 /DNA_START=28 /DNA_END=1458 /DNA_ORIENTATION=+
MSFHSSCGRPAYIMGAQAIVSSSLKKSKSELTARTTTDLIRQAFRGACRDAGVNDIDEFVPDAVLAVPSLAEPHFMEAHYQASQLFASSSSSSCIKNKTKMPYCKTVDTGGASPITALLEGARLIATSSDIHTVAVIAADTVASLDTPTFLERANDTFHQLSSSSTHDHSTTTDHRKDNNNNMEERSKNNNIPFIPWGYSQITQYQMEHCGLTRDQLYMTLVLLSHHAALHPQALQRTPYSDISELQKQSLSHPKNISIAPHISIKECARRADGAGCILLSSSSDDCAAIDNNDRDDKVIQILAGAEASSALIPPSDVNNITEHHINSFRRCIDSLYRDANMTVNDIDFFALYDCFPICLIRALEACGIADHHQGGKYVEQQYNLLMQRNHSHQNSLFQDKSFFPVNTHGGLLCYGAPWEVPAIYNAIEAIDQLQGRAKGRSIENCQTALVYGNGGILSASAVMILKNIERKGIMK